MLLLYRWRVEREKLKESVEPLPPNVSGFPVESASPLIPGHKSCNSQIRNEKNIALTNRLYSYSYISIIVIQKYLYLHTYDEVNVRRLQFANKYDVLPMDWSSCSGTNCPTKWV